jgi:hypothetical protein
MRNKNSSRCSDLTTRNDSITSISTLLLIRRLCFILKVILSSVLLAACSERVVCTDFRPEGSQGQVVPTVVFGLVTSSLGSLLR